ncbi:MAG: hypothetical protein HQK83_07520 [Fibrobacteria bacterium]|nr:hypothetical protein [Fibrobacteria bacterium]
MNKKIIIVLFIVSLAYSLFGAAIDVRGRVFNILNEPLENVLVSMPGQDVTVSSAADGTFRLTSETLNISGAGLSVHEIKSSNGIIHLNMLIKEKVKLSLYNVKGQLLHHVINSSVGPGAHSLPLFPGGGAFGLYFLKGGIGSQSVAFPLLYTAECRRVLKVKQAPLAKHTVTGKEIVFKLNGYKDVSITLDNPVQNVNDIFLLTEEDTQTHGIKIAKAFENDIIMRLHLPSEAEYQLLELWPFQQYSSQDSYRVMWEGNQTHILAGRFDGSRDVMFNKYQLINKSTRAAIGGYHYVTEFEMGTSRSFPLMHNSEKKGLSNVEDLDDAIALGTKHVHINIGLGRFVVRGVSTKYRINVNGETVYFSEEFVNILDSEIKKFTDNNINVFIVLLNYVGKNDSSSLRPPGFVVADETKPGHWAGFNVTSGQGIKYLRGSVEFLADRYTREDKKYGQICTIILGNEINMHYAWYNLGEVSNESLLEQYHTAMRITDISMRKHHRLLRQHVPTAYYWDSTWHSPTWGISARNLYKGLQERSEAGGNFPWNLAIHPYPVNLFFATWWVDPSPIRSFSTLQLTMKNIEVLPVFLRHENIRYKGDLRGIDITEQGYHNMDTSLAEQKMQAAAYACAFNKVKNMPEIGAYIYHRHVSDTAEGGLDLGLWTWDNPPQKKYIYEVFKQSETPGQESAYEFAKPILGINNWKEGFCFPDYNNISTE